MLNSPRCGPVRFTKIGKRVYIFSTYGWDPSPDTQTQRNHHAEPIFLSNTVKTRTIIRTYWFKNLQAEFGHLNTQKYKNLFSVAKNGFYTKQSLQFLWSNFSILTVWETFTKGRLCTCFFLFTFVWIFTRKRSMFCINLPCNIDDLKS